MSYAVNGLIQASDFNTFATQLNTLWATGTGPRGLGQTPIQTVAVGSKVTAAQWDSIIAVSNALSYQQGPHSIITQPTYVPSNSGSDAQTLIQYMSVISTNITTLSSNYLNSHGQVSLTPATITSTQQWSTEAIYSFTVSFASGDAARYFFNSGGQIAITMSHPTGTPLDSMYAVLCQQIGSIIISAPGISPSTAHIAGSDYTGLTQVTDLQGAVPDTFVSQAGYYGLTASSAEIFKQRMDTGFYSNYLGSAIAISAKTNGTQGLHGDNGSSITINVVWSEIPATLSVSSGTTIALTLKQSSTYPTDTSSSTTNSWGTPKVQYTATYI